MQCNIAYCNAILYKRKLLIPLFRSSIIPYSAFYKLPGYGHEHADVEMKISLNNGRDGGWYDID